MTKQEFIDGKPFTMGNFNEKFAYKGLPNGNGIIVNHGLGGYYIGNMEKLGSRMFKMFTFVMNKKCTVKARYEDLTLYVPKDK